jgi:hypothetical protein
MSTLSEHSAPGQALGYYFQLERALSWIAKSPAFSYVGIETEDDVVVKLASGEKIFEQDKSSTTTYPFSPSRKDLWNSLLIWLDAIANEEIDIKNATFYLVTNKLKDNSLADTIGTSNTKDEIQVCIAAIREKVKEITGEVKILADKVVTYSDDCLYELIERVKYKSGEEVFGDTLRREIESDLQLDTETPEQNDFIINALTGWLFKNTLEAWRNKKAAFISRDDFVREKINIQTNFRQAIVNQLIIEMGEIPEEQQRAEWKNRYVRQLEIIGCTTDDIYNAIHDYLNAVSKRTQLAKKGYLTILQLEELDKNLEEHWKVISRSTKIKYKALDAQEVGQLVYFDTIGYDTSVGPYSLRSHFLTRGSYHTLADQQKIGWHPNYKLFLKSTEGILKPIDEKVKNE